MSKFSERIGQVLNRPLFCGQGGASGLGRWNTRTVAGLLNMPIVDAESEVGELWKSSIPLACLKFEQRAAIELEICVQTNDENGDWVNAPKHRALSLLRNPNKFHSAAQLFDCIRWDYHLDGNAYLWKERSASDKVIALWWIPSWMIDPRWEEDGTEWISCYEYRVNGRTLALPVEDVVHFRNGIDPRWAGRKGLSEFAGVVREVLSDDEAGVLVASLMKNGGMPGVIISPEGQSGNMAAPKLDKADRDNLREYWDENFGGDNRGRPFIHNIPIKVQFPAYNPQQLVLDKVRAIPEQRIAGTFGLPMSVLQLGSGVVNSNSRANKSDDRKQAYESCIIPTSISLALELTAALLSEFERDITNYRVWFDSSNILCLQEDMVAVVTALSTACGGPFMTVNEARKKRGLKPIEGGEKLREAQAKPKEQSNQQTASEDETADDTVTNETQENETQEGDEINGQN